MSLELRLSNAARSIDQFLPRIYKQILLKPILFVIELFVSATDRDQLLVRASLDYFAGLDHEYLVRAADGR